MTIDINTLHPTDRATLSALLQFANDVPEDLISNLDEKTYTVLNDGNKYAVEEATRGLIKVCRTQSDLLPEHIGILKATIACATNSPQAFRKFLEKKFNMQESDKEVLEQTLPSLEATLGLVVQNTR